MKRIYRFAEPIGVASFTHGDLRVELPVFVGVLKHASGPQLCALLRDPVVARKYTQEALRKLSWHALRRFPRDWLLDTMTDARLPDARRRALAYMLAPSP